MYSPVIDTSLPYPLVRQSIDLERADGAESLWHGVVKYGRKARKETGESEWYFDTSGGQTKVQQSLATIGGYAREGFLAPDFQGAIGVTESSVEGVEITVPQFSFGETHYLAASVVTLAYARAVATLTGKVNAAPFRSFYRGEVLFLGASGRRRGEEDWEISFKFTAIPNALGLQVGGIVVPEKEGWHYLWVRYEDEKDEAAKVLTRRPVAAYVEQVYQYGDFGLLGIGS